MARNYRAVLKSGLNSLRKTLNRGIGLIQKRPIHAAGLWALAVAVLGVAYNAPRLLPKAKSFVAAKQAEHRASVTLGEGHELFKTDRAKALGFYDAALKQAPTAADEQVITNLVNCFGQKEQATAEQIIARHKLAGAQKLLAGLVTDKNRTVRWRAIVTLEKLGAATRAHYVSAYVEDLSEKSCDVRRGALEKLGDIGDASVIAALDAAKAQEKKDTPWYKINCMGSRIDKTKKKVEARKHAAKPVAVATR